VSWQNIKTNHSEVMSIKSDILKNAIVTISRQYHKAVNNRDSINEAREDKTNLSLYMNTTLTQEEQHLITTKWGRIINCIPRGYIYFTGLKSLRGFDANYLPSCYYNPYIVHTLNPKQWKFILSHKSLFKIAYGIGIKHPNTVLCSYGGVFLDSSFNPLLHTEAIAKVRKAGCALLYKPATTTSQGHGIRLYKTDDEMDILCDKIRSLEILSAGDFVLQEIITQSKDTVLFNNSSLNCMRITTLNLNGEVSVCTRAIKCGPKNSVVDNIGRGKSGVIVGIDNDGCLDNIGFYGNGETATSHNDVVFSGKKITAFQKVLDAAILLHKYVPMCKIIGWDIALDANDEPVLIEGNVICPGLSFEQMCSGPAFGTRTDEVIEYLISQKKNRYPINYKIHV
jgi:hypothetical protein